MSPEKLQARWDEFAQSRLGTALVRVARWAFFVAVAVYLYLELARIGWREILGSLPTQPLFYVLFLALYVSLPVTEVIIYRRSWRLPFLGSMPAFLKKRVYNRDVLGYSGEFYFYSWARQNIGATDGDIARTVRDNNIISSVASTLIAVVLLAVFILYGEIKPSALFGRNWMTPAALVVLGLVVLVPILVRFRKHFFSMPAALAASVLGIQCLRLVVGQILQIGQWAVVMPEVDLGVWFTFAAVSILVSRIPFLPNQNLVFLGAGIEMSNHMAVPAATLAGTLLVVNLLDKAINLGVLALINVRQPLGDSHGAAVSDSPLLVSSSLDSPGQTHRTENDSSTTEALTA